jgi:hypothetical protein
MKTTLSLLGIILLISCGNKHFKPDANMIAIAFEDSVIHPEVGQKVFYQANIHGSVGINEVATSLDESVLKFVGEYKDYVKPKRANMPGGDYAIMTFVFEALQSGETSLIIRKIFRGELKEEARVKCVIKNSE